MDGAEVPLYAIRCSKCGVVNYQDIINIPCVVGKDFGFYEVFYVGIF